MPLLHTYSHQGANISIWSIAEPEEYYIKHTGLQTLIAHPQRRIEYYAGRFLLQTLCPKLVLSDIRVLPIGKPYWPGQKLQFSISHSYPYVAVAVHPDRCVGVDIQVYKPKIIGLQSKFLNKEEQVMADNSEHMITLFWSVKEALYKWAASGGQDFKSELLIQQMQQMASKYRFGCSVLKAGRLCDAEVMGMIMPHFSIAVCVG